ncbi:MAG: ATP-binding cassette domain-containing protein [Leptospirillum sp.]
MIPSKSLDVDLELQRPGSPRLEVRCSISLGKTYLLGVCGPSGSGKTSFLRMLAGLLSPDRGSIVMGDSVWFDRDTGIDFPTERRAISYLPQNVCLFPHMTIRENLLFAAESARPEKKRRFFAFSAGAGLYGKSPDGYAEELARLSTLFGIEDLMDKKVGKISGGQARKVALARMFLKPCSLYLLDEPLTGIDPAARQSLTGVILGILEQTGVPAIWVTHSPDEVACVANEMAEFSISESEDRAGWLQRTPAARDKFFETG